MKYLKLFEDGLSRLNQLGMVDPVEAAKAHLVKISNGTSLPIKHFRNYADYDEFIPEPNPISRFYPNIPLVIEITPEGWIKFLWIGNLWDKDGTLVRELRRDWPGHPWQEITSDDWQTLITELPTKLQ
jgi:hypothetical protein